MALFHNKYRVESARLAGYDYTSPGYYFLTICTHCMQHQFGAVRDGQMLLNDVGKIAADCWRAIPDHFENIVLDEFVVMPNHVHGILRIVHDVEMGKITESGVFVETQHAASLRNNQKRDLKPNSISAAIRSYKSAVAKWCRSNGQPHFRWQSRFYDHIIRDDDALRNIRRYIRENLLKWGGGDRCGACAATRLRVSVSE